MTRPVVDIADIVAGLAARIRELAVMVFPAGVIEGNELRVGSLAGEPGRSLAVHLSGARAGIWSDFAAGDKRGDALDLVAQAWYGGDKGRALKWARGFLGYESLDPAETERRLAAQRRRAATVQAREAEARVRRRQSAFSIWLAAQERIAGTPVDAYLKGRGLDLSRLGRQPGCLRYHPALWHRPTDAKHPAMVALIHGPAVDQQTGEIRERPLAIHRTWLACRDGRWTKLPHDTNKAVWPGYRGGCIRLWRGASGKALKDAPAGETAVIVEGIEDGLTAVLADPALRVLAAVSLDNMAALDLPPAIGTVVLVFDNDPERSPDGSPHPTVRARANAVRHHQSRGRRVLIARAPADHPGGAKDLNDLVQHGPPGSASGTSFETAAPAAFPARCPGQASG